MSNFCGPEKENCVANQTLKDTNCLVPCTGLYADIEDNSMKQLIQAFEHNMVTGRLSIKCVLKIDLHLKGFHMMTQELSHGVRFWNSGSKERLQQMFPNSADKKVDRVKSFTESYHKYKRNYVKHLGFNPKEENLSKCNLSSSFSSASSFCAGACTTRGSVHLL